MYIVTDGSRESINYYRSLIDDTIVALKNNDIEIKVNMTHRYQEQANEATSVMSTILFYVKIAAVVIMIIALLIIILSTYLSMLNQIGNIAVYRMLGYSRLRLSLIYIIELFLLSLIYTVIGGVISFLTMFILDVVPLVPYTMFTPVYQIILVVLAISLAVTIIGLIPVSIVFRLTPAQLNARFAKKIGNE